VIDKYDSFSTFSTDIFGYLLSNQTIALSLIGILILYFGYYSTRYQPIRTERLHLYLSGFQFLSTYFILQMLIIYFFLEYVTPFNLVYLSSLFFLFILLIYIFGKIKYSTKTLVLKVLITIVLIYTFPKLLWNYISQLEDIGWIVFILILYQATMVIKSNSIKELINHNSYNYKDFYSKIKEMNLFMYPIFSYPLRISQSVFFNIIFGKDKKEHIQKSATESFETNEAPNEDQEFEIVSDRLKSTYSPAQLKIAGMNIQTSILEVETWFNSLLTLIFLYLVLTYFKISVIIGLILFTYLFFALTSIAIEHSIYRNGFLLIELFPKIGESFKCRLMEIDEKLIKVLLKGEIANKKFNPVEFYPINEVSKIRYISMGEMLDEF